MSNITWPAALLQRVLEDDSFFQEELDNNSKLIRILDDEIQPASLAILKQYSSILLQKPDKTLENTLQELIEGEEILATESEFSGVKYTRKFKPEHTIENLLKCKKEKNFLIENPNSDSRPKKDDILDISTDPDIVASLLVQEDRIAAKNAAIAERERAIVRQEAAQARKQEVCAAFLAIYNTRLKLRTMTVGGVENTPTLWMEKDTTNIWRLVHQDSAFKLFRDYIKANHPQYGLHAMKEMFLDLSHDLWHNLDHFPEMVCYREFIKTGNSYTYKYYTCTYDGTMVTMREGKPNPEDFCFFSFDIEKGETPLTDTAIMQIFSGNKEKYDWWLWWSGYGCTPFTHTQVMYKYMSDGSSGKSTLLDIQEAMAGKYALSGSLNELLSNKFQASELLNKTLFVSRDSELPSSFVDRMKSLVDNAPTLLAERKGKNPFQFVMRAKLNYSGNIQEAIAENTHAVKRRLKIVELYESYEQGIWSPQKKIIEKELRKLRYKAVMMYLTSPNKPVVCKDIEKTTLEYHGELDHTQEFIDQYTVTEEKTLVVQFQDLYKEYYVFMLEQKNMPKSKKYFKNLFEKTLGIESAQHRIAGKKVRGYKIKKTT